ncbi:MAG: hypothetical protein M1820_004364 [Bogoriella megaspora]|nr:MAG: hypothetical protein M1820_004364 [Bogoriella megaspora]
MAEIHLEHAIEHNHEARTALKIIHYAYPILLLLFFLAAFTIHGVLTSNADNSKSAETSPETGPGGKPLPQRKPIKPGEKHQEPALSRPQKLIFEWLSVGAAFTFAANAALVVIHAVAMRKEKWWCGQADAIYIVGSFFVYALFLISLLDAKPSPNTAHLGTWLLAICLEIAMLAVSLSVYTRRHREPMAGNPWGGALRWNVTQWEATEVVIDIVRILFLIALIVFYLLFVTLRKKSKAEDPLDESETTGLLSSSRAENGHGNGYGSTPHAGKKPHGEDAPAGWSRPTTTPSHSWWEYIGSYSVFFPYLWPSKDRMLQLLVVLCFCIVILQRIVNVAVPHQVGVITDELSGENGPMRMPWGAICLFVVFRLLQGTNGLLGATRSVLWIPVGQYSYRELSVAAFEHVHGLSLDFHLGKKTGEVLSALGKGNSINTFLEQVTFQVVPMLVDLCVAIAYFLIEFDAYYALVVAVVTFWYIYLTIRMAQWRAEIRRQMVNADREEDAVKSALVFNPFQTHANIMVRNDSMVSYETVKYFNAEPYEFNRYREAVGKYQKAETKVLMSLNLMNVTQNTVFMVGLMVACFIAAYQVTNGQRKVGQFVSLLTYFAQLQSPLNFFGTFYRMIQSAMINSERMLELFKEKPTVVDSPTAKQKPACYGDIRFEDVHFSYDERKPALSGLNIHCAPGTTTALVGESGGGKSTVFRLLFRFYNTEAGNILIDNENVEDITIDSLRRHIGVVPQDTVLFNETLMYNLKYANPDASDEDVYAACRAASIHDKILGFPDGYQTKVGERGLRLSGGEKQRVAIARTILKNPRIILLDEATAALDTETEEHIQEALTTLAEGRTMLVIAHRLSTITMADQILVLNEGRVAEQGTHEQLLAKKGRYATMWRKQVRAQRAAEEARILKDKADRLRRESRDGGGTGSMGSASSSQSEDEKEIEAQKRAASSSKKSGEHGNDAAAPARGGS